MSLHMTYSAKFLLASLGLRAAAEVAKVVVDRKLVARAAPPDTFGLPLDLYNELAGYTFSDDRKGFMAALDRTGAPRDIEFRKNLWQRLSGR